jgi:protein-tyrosine phosphatase
MGFRDDDRERRVFFGDAHNFRDFGGYRATGGRTVKRGLLYRSDELSHLTEVDLASFSRLGIAVVCDFRSPKEREKGPTRLGAYNPPRTVLLPSFSNRMDSTDIINRLSSGDVDGLDLEQYMLAGYRSIKRPLDHYRTLFRLVSDPSNLPLLIHCSGGKDRTGRAAALILYALGVPEETIIHDYMLSNEYLAERTEKILEYFWTTSNYRTHPDVARPLLEVRREYLGASWGAMKEEYGSVEAYLRDAVGLDDRAREGLRRVLLD